MVAAKLPRSAHEVFIENAVRLLAKSKVDYSAALFTQLDAVRSPYVQSLICIVVGFRGNENVIPSMMQRFLDMKNQYPNETFAQGPLLALCELQNRFYSQ